MGPQPEDASQQNRAILLKARNATRPPPLRGAASCAEQAGQGQTGQAGTTLRLTTASTSSCTLTVTWCDPSDLIGLPTMILRLSTCAPPLTAPWIAVAMSVTVTAPNRRPPSPARTGRSTVVVSS